MLHSHGGWRHTVLLFCFTNLSLMRKTMRVWTKRCRLPTKLHCQHCSRSRWRTGHKLHLTNHPSPSMCQHSHGRHMSCVLLRGMSMMVMNQKSMSLSRKMWVYWLVLKSWCRTSEGAIGSCRCKKVSLFSTWQGHYWVELLTFWWYSEVSILDFQRSEGSCCVLVGYDTAVWQVNTNVWGHLWVCVIW